MDGIIVVNKPKGITSHDVVDRVRKKLKMKRVGHAGTLDPLATGVIIILVGKGTKFSEQFIKYDKAYNATMILGTTSSRTRAFNRDSIFSCSSSNCILL